GAFGGIDRRDGIERARTFRRAATDPAYEALRLQPQCGEEGFIGRWRPEEAAFLRVRSAEHLDLAHITQREPAAERDQPRRTSGHSAKHLGALGIAVDRRVGSDARGDCPDFLDLLAG